MCLSLGRLCFDFYADIRCVSCLTGTYAVIYTEIRYVSCFTDTCLVFYADVRCVSHLVDTCLAYTLISDVLAPEQIHVLFSILISHVLAD